MRRSITAQIEHWAKLGRYVENALQHEDVLALKRAEADDDTLTRASIEGVLRRVAGSIDRNDLARALMSGRTVYQSDPKGSGAIERIEPNGRRTLGRFENRRFIERERTAARRR